MKRRPTVAEEMRSLREQLETANENLQSDQAAKRLFATQIMDILGLSAAYEDKYTYRVYGGLPATKEEYLATPLMFRQGWTTTTAADVFIEDVAKAAAASEGKEALKRITQAARSTLK